MTDRELLEKAAKAHGGVNFGCERWYDSATDDVWNPLEDDGDALRLAVKLRLIVEPWAESACTVRRRPDGSRRARIIAVHGCAGDGKATRRAIVRAAASLAGD